MKFRCGVYTSPFLIFLLINLSPASLQGQTGRTDTLVVAGKQYEKSGLHQLLWGKHYRKDWTTPVRMPIIYLDTINGGLKAYQAGGGRQSSTLRLRNPNEKEYVMRSIDKSFGKALPEIYRGTFIEKLADDQVSIAEPYAALTVAPMAKAAGIFHTNPVIGFIPRQDALGEFNAEYGDQLYLVEQRPDENWEEAANFGNAKKLVGTDKMLEKTWEDNDNIIDQPAFVKARLFDMFIGDWGRHEDQWRWGVFELDDKKIYKPVPRDRDQVYTKFDGLLLSIGLSAGGAGHLETFGPTIKNIQTYNYPARNLDRRAASEPTKEQWLQAAKELQQNLTDAVIENAVKRLPPEVYNNEGPAITSALLSRREKLQEFAAGYYAFLAREVEIPGTHKAEYFQVITTSLGTEVKLFDLDKNGEPKKEAFYSRLFLPGETKEIRIYGLSGTDKYSVDQQTGNGIRIRLIGGPDRDQYSFKGEKRNIDLYDNAANEIVDAGNVKMHISENPLIHHYEYAGFKYDDKGIGPVISYSSEDHILVGVKYTLEKQKWRKLPFGSRQELAAIYSLSERAFSFGYEGIFTRAIGRWNLLLNGVYDQVRWNNFYGIGNETVMGTDDRDYHRVRTREIHGSIGIQKNLAKHHDVRISGLIQSIRLLNDPGRFHTEQLPKLVHYTSDVYGGGQLVYAYNGLDNGVVPTKGFHFRSGVRFLQNLREDSSVLTYSGEMNIFFPLSKSFVFSVKTGGASLSGDPQFYHLNRIGGTKTLRGFRKYRFYGESVFYNQAELQFIKDLRSSLMNGKIGLIALYDIGRVWQPGEDSDEWHSAYGGGIMLAPFNKFSVAVFYAVSKNETDIGVRFTKGF